jgi:hypothetical protein
MVELNKIAIDNLKLLCELENNNIKFNRLYLTKISKEEDECEKIVDIREIDHIIYFTFHQLFFSIQKTTILGDRYNKDKLLLLKDMNRALDNIYLHFSVNEKSKIFNILVQIETILDDFKSDCWFNFSNKTNNILNFTLTPIYKLVDDINKKYKWYYNFYNYVCYKDDLEALNEILNAEQETEKQETEKQDEKLEENIDLNGIDFKNDLNVDENGNITEKNESSEYSLFSFLYKKIN